MSIRCSARPFFFLFALLALLLARNLPVSAQPGDSSRSFTNDNGMTILDESVAMPYPSAIVVSGLTGIVTRVLVTVRGLNHSYSDDIDMLLVAPGGRSTILMSDAGGTLTVTEAVITFDDTAPPIPNQSEIFSGEFAPANWGVGGDSFPSPAPAGPYPAALATFNGIDPNGTWSLYIVDDIGGNDGNIADGWILSISTAQVLPSLSIVQVGSTARLSWPETSPGYTLEARPALGSGPSWSMVTNAVIVTNGQYRATVSLSDKQRFFRLRK